MDFQASRLEDIERAFHESVDDYLEFCAARGERPDKPYSGKLVFRTTPELHRQLAITAELENTSINQLLEKAAQHVVPPV